LQPQRPPARRPCCSRAKQRSSQLGRDVVVAVVISTSRMSAPRSTGRDGSSPAAQSNSSSLPSARTWPHPPPSPRATQTPPSQSSASPSAEPRGERQNACGLAAMPGHGQHRAVGVVADVDRFGHRARRRCRLARPHPRSAPQQCPFDLEPAAGRVVDPRRPAGGSAARRRAARPRRGAEVVVAAHALARQELALLAAGQQVDHAAAADHPAAVGVRDDAGRCRGAWAGSRAPCRPASSPTRRRRSRRCRRSRRPARSARLEQAVRATEHGLDGLDLCQQCHRSASSRV